MDSARRSRMRLIMIKTIEFNINELKEALATEQKENVEFDKHINEKTPQEIESEMNSRADFEDRCKDEIAECYEELERYLPKNC